MISQGHNVLHRLLSKLLIFDPVLQINNLVSEGIIAEDSAFRYVHSFGNEKQFHPSDIRHIHVPGCGGTLLTENLLPEGMHAEACHLLDKVHCLQTRKYIENYLTVTLLYLSNEAYN